jgi:putative ABC transport system permease protein
MSELVETLFQDVRYAFRMLRKNSGFTLVVVLTLALGIGANTAIFSVARGIFFGSATYPDANRLMFVSRGYPGFPQGGGNFTYPAYRDMLQQNTSFDTLAAFQSFGALALTDYPQPVRVNINYITPSYFDLLGVRTTLGRTFHREEDRFGDADPLVVLSYGFWQRQFAGDPGVVGRSIHLNQQAFTVIGVTSDSFVDAPGEMDSGESVDAWIPLGLASKFTGYSSTTDRMASILWGVGHLKPGVSVEQAHAEFLEIAKRLEQQYPATDRGFNLVVRPLQEQLIGQFYSPVWLLIGASAFILLIGCANVANLLLARLAGRRRELAVRLALGGTRARLACQMLIESSALVSLAAGVGLLLATWGVSAVRQWGRLNLPHVLQFRVDGWMLIASVLVSAVTALIFGLGPALAGSRTDVRDSLSQSGRQGISLGRRRATRLLVVSEVGLAIVLLVGAGLLLKSLHRLTSVDLGFNTQNLLTLRIDLNSDRYTPPENRIAFAKRLVEDAGNLPGVKSATLTGPGVPGRATWVIEAVAEGRDPGDAKNIIMSNRHSVNPGALANLGIPLLRGREFTEQDSATSPRVAIVSESTAKAYWPGEDAIGKRFRRTSDAEWMTVVGIASDALLSQRFLLSDAAIGIPPSGLGPQRDVYLPYPQRPNRALVLAVRTAGDAGAVIKSLRSAVLAIDPTLPVYDITLLQDRLADQDQASRAVATLTGFYAAVALFLAALGLCGVLAHAVSRRTQEIGIRMALGALPRNVLVMVLGEGLWLTLAGILGGVACAALLTHLMTTLLFGVSATDPAVYAGISGLLLAVALAACFLPARRATKVDPMVALRYE